MRYRSPRHPCSCRSVGECFHNNGPTLGEDLDTLGQLVDGFAAAMRGKLTSKAKHRGGWDEESWTVEDIKRALIEHIERGDPVDVANYCAFWWNRLALAGGGK